MAGDGKKTLILGIVAVVAVAGLLGFLFRSSSSKEAGTMDPRSEPITRMQDLGKQMMRTVPTSASQGAPNASAQPAAGATAAPAAGSTTTR